MFVESCRGYRGALEGGEGLWRVLEGIEWLWRVHQEVIMEDFLDCHAHNHDMYMQRVAASMLAVSYNPLSSLKPIQ